ncbi:peptide cleavage/export ABC transporter [Staphylococcus shinii]|uniref:peptidase domain-containing ABC transporter n=1 Tax=Staphylococcus shinii TaxID=2912228 RepID=UPI000C323A9A|nr:peptidase domain-containing ABC transporter [Staphylococcus shinii]PKI08246.1 peptide cleavage/export ABC transporter [Staphylococcus shinii]
MKVKFIQQQDEKDCGPVCLAMISQYYGKRVSISKLRELSGTDTSGTNMYGMIQAAKTIGLNMQAGKVPDLRELEQAPFPIIAHIQNKQGYLHYVVIEKMDKENVFLVDPAIGRSKMKKKVFENYWTNIILIAKTNDNFTKNDDYPSIKPLFKNILKNNKFYIIIILTASVLINAIGFGGTYYFKILVDHILPTNILEHLNYLSLALLILYVTYSFSSYLRYHLILELSLRIDFSLMKQYFAHVLKLPVHFFDTRKPGEILSRFLDISKIREAFSSVTVTLVVDSLMVILGSILLYIQSPFLFYISLLFIPIYFILGFIFKGPFEQYNRKVMEENAFLSSYLIETFSGASTIKNYNAEDEFYENGNKRFVQFLKQVRSLGVFKNIQLTLNDFFKLLANLTILWIGSMLVMEDQLTLGGLLTFNALLTYFLDPIERLINVQPIIQSSIVAARRIVEVTDLKTENNKNDFYNTSNYSLEKIQTQNIYYRYNYDDYILKNINITINKGDLIGIVGESGSGKSTLAKLLCNYYSTKEGEILLNGEKIHKYSLNKLRSKIGYIDQNTFAFSKSIIENLTIGINKQVSIEKIVYYCKKVELHDFIMSLPNNYNTVLEDKGENLSGGQLQRLSIARALIKEPDVYILDEATSALDSLNENKIMSYFRDLSNNKIVIIISHKLSNIRHSKTIYSLQNGCIVENGNHEQLMKNHSLYYQMWKNQNF